MSTVGANIDEAERLTAEKNWLQICSDSDLRDGGFTYGDESGGSKAGRFCILLRYDFRCYG